MIEISDFNDLEKMNLEHTDLENCEHIAETSLFRNRPAPIVSEYKKKNDEQIDVQQTIHDAEMETEQIIERTTTETSNVTKMSFLIDTEDGRSMTRTARGRAKTAVPRSSDTEWETKLFEIRFFSKIYIGISRVSDMRFWENIGEVQQSVLFLYKDEYVYFTQDKKG